MDVDRFEKDMAALTPGGVVSALNLSGINPSFGNGTLYTWTLGLERKLGNLTANAAYVAPPRKSCPATVSLTRFRERAGLCAAYPI